MWQSERRNTQNASLWRVLRKPMYHDCPLCNWSLSNTVSKGQILQGVRVESGHAFRRACFLEKQNCCCMRKGNFKEFPSSFGLTKTSAMFHVGTQPSCDEATSSAHAMRYGNIV
ncbi:hypothetical protein REMIM1_PF00237 (plasmid) [Rhizobium etli bv. mimosae str. Mim1]|nr:hypothetical protein REMIM1_PF00237 [Rhizobium etli bv. mimosae str. Mim1]